MEDVFFATRAIQAFWDQLPADLQPRHREAFRVVLIDLDVNGHCSSVHSPPGKTIELSKIPLYDHTLRVLRLVLRDGNSRYTTLSNGARFTALADVCVQLACLTHDIGKAAKRIPQGLFDRTDHLAPGGKWIRNNLQMLTSAEIETVYDAVIHHHGTKYLETDLCIAARVARADFLAREEETKILGEKASEERKTVQKISSRGALTTPGEEVRREEIPRTCPVPDPLDETASMGWLDINVLIERLFWKFNAPFGKGEIPAFSLNDGTCYVGYNLLFEMVTKMAMEANREPLVISMSENPVRKNNVLAYIVSKLPLAKDRLPKNYFFAQYNIEFSRGIASRYGRYIPLLGRELYAQGQLTMIRDRKRGRGLDRISLVCVISGNWRKK